MDLFNVDIFLGVFKQVIIMFVLIVTGIVSAKKNIITEKSAKQIANFILIVVTPSLIIHSYQRDFDASQLYNLVLAFVLAVLSHVVAIGYVTFFIKKREDAEYRIERFAAVYSNAGFLAFPLLSSVLGSIGIFYGAAYVSVFNILTWTNGVKFLEPSEKINLKKAFINPGMIGFLIGFVMFVFSIRLPEVVAMPVEYLSDLNTPLAMILSGIYLSRVNIKSALNNFRIFVPILFKLIITPITMILILCVINYCGIFPSLDTNVCTANIIATACPTATAVMMFTSRHNLDAGYAAEIFAVSTILSVITLPFMTSVIMSIL